MPASVPAVMSLKLLRRVIFDVMSLGNASIPLLFRFFDCWPNHFTSRGFCRRYCTTSFIITHNENFSASSNGWNIEGGLEEP
jgi:hypothetical protein